MIFNLLHVVDTLISKYIKKAKHAVFTPIKLTFKVRMLWKLKASEKNQVTFIWTPWLTYIATLFLHQLLFFKGVRSSAASTYFSRRHRCLISFDDQAIKFDATDLCSSAYYAQNRIILNILKSILMFNFKVSISDSQFSSHHSLLLNLFKVYNSLLYLKKEWWLTLGVQANIFNPRAQSRVAR